MLGISKEVDRLLELCNVKSNEKVIVMTPSVYNEAVAEQFMESLYRLGADYSRVILPPKKTLIGTGFGSREFSSLDVQILKSADFVLSIALRHGSPGSAGWRYPEVLYFSPPYIAGMEEIQGAGTRWLDIIIPYPGINFRRLFPSKDLIRRTMAGVKLMTEAESIRVVSDAGTDLTLRKKKGDEAIKEVGQVTQPGEWDIFGFGVLAGWSIADTAEGTLVIDTNDYLLGDLRKPVMDPIKLTFKDGSCENMIEGGYSADLLKGTLATAKDPRAYKTSHIGWGTHDGAVWHDNPWFCVADAESYMGNMQIALGRSPTNMVKYHIDIELLNCSFYLDDVEIVRKGKIIHPECK